MDNDDVKMVEAKMELERISELQKYKEEFDKLGSNDWGLKDLLSIIAPFGLLLHNNLSFDHPITSASITANIKL